ncbi:MAG TPA: hypothetical protein DCX27_07315 [Balneola sp.]|nr:hypothetical protein [Balneola sp.]
MRHYKVNRLFHTVYEDSEELPQNIKRKVNHKRDQVSIGDWIETDDGCYMEVLRSGNMTKAKGKNRKVSYIGTRTGTYLLKSKIDSSRRENIYTLSGLDPKTMTRENLNKYERLFVQYLVGGMKPVEAYIKSFPTDNPGYANFKSAELTKTKRIRKAMKKELEPVLEKLGITQEYVLEGIKSTIEVAENDDTKLKALFKLSDILDLEDKSSAKVTQLTGIQFQGFSEEQLDKAERPKEIESGT